MKVCCMGAKSTLRNFERRKPVLCVPGCLTQNDQIINGHAKNQWTHVLIQSGHGGLCSSLPWVGCSQVNSRKGKNEVISQEHQSAKT